MSEGGTYTSGYSDQEAAAALRANPGQVQTSSDPFVATQETIQYLCALIRDSLQDGIVQTALRDAVHFFPFISPYQAIWNYCKRRVKFSHHSGMLGEWIGAPDELQLLIRPDALLKMKRPRGDCAVFTGLVCAMLECAGIEWEIVTVAVDPRAPGIFSHVYPRVVFGGLRIPLDASHGKYPGWEVPRSRVSALQVWDSSGNPISDLDSGFRGLHNYDGGEEHFMYPGLAGYGLGQDPSVFDLTDIGNTDTGTLPTYDPGTSASCLPGELWDSQYGCYTAPNPLTTASAPAGSAAAASQLSPASQAALIKLGSQFASIFGATQGVTQITGPGGQTYVAPANAGAPSASLFSASASGSSWLVIGGLVIGAVLLMSMMGGKR